jgi:hypothetical protein
MSLVVQGVLREKGWAAEVPPSFMVHGMQDDV